MNVHAKAGNVRQLSLFVEYPHPPHNQCPRCGDSFAAIVCPYCKIPIGPFAEGKKRQRESDEDVRH